MRDGVLDQLDTSVLLTVPAYLASGPGGSAAAPGPPGACRRDVAAHQEGTWTFAAPLGVTRLEVPDVDARQDAAAGTRIGLLTPGGSARWFPAVAAGPSRLTISLSRPLASVAVVAEAGGHAVRLRPASVTDTGGRVFVADGQLQEALVPPRWGYAGHDGSFAVFVDRFARGASASRRSPAGPPPAPRSAGRGPGCQPRGGGRLLLPRRPGHPVGGRDGRVGRDLDPRQGGAAGWPCTGTVSSRPSTCRPAGSGDLELPAAGFRPASRCRLVRPRSSSCCWPLGCSWCVRDARARAIWDPGPPRRAAEPLVRKI